jgi:hypothetical protein
LTAGKAKTAPKMAKAKANGGKHKSES